MNRGHVDDYRDVRASTGCLPVHLQDCTGKANGRGARA